MLNSRIVKVLTLFVVIIPRPALGVVLTDPRGRRVGFDPLTKHAWQQFPEAEGYLDCDDLHGSDACRGMVQACGPVSGTYKLEMIEQKTTTYGVSISSSK